MNTKRFLKPILFVYASTWLFSLLFFLIQIGGRNTSVSEMLAFYSRFITSMQGLIILHVFFILLFLVYFLGRYFINLYKSKGPIVCFKRLLVRLIFPVGLIVFGIKEIISYHSTEVYDYTWNTAIENKNPMAVAHYKKDQKHRGMTVYRIGRSRDFPLDSLVSSNIEWIAVLPYFYQQNESTDSIERGPNRDGWSRRDSSFIAGIKRIKEKGFKVFLKPHLWLGDGWRSNINFKNPKQWDNWFESYKKTMLHYAKMAELTNSEMLCIGTELKTSVIAKPEAWNKLIAQIRSIYSGKLTYAANWDDELDAVPFWGQMDYIGVQAYFPLTKDSYPSLKQIKDGWKPHKARLEALARQYGKKVLFTEIGYKKDSDATVRPWEWGSRFSRLFVAKSEKTQTLAFEALYSEFWHLDWFAGSYIWQWQASGNFAVKGSPAQNKIAEWYNKVIKQPAPEQIINSALR